MLKTCAFVILSSYTKNWHRRQHATSADQHSTTLLPLTRVIVRGAVSRRALGDGYCCQSPKDGHRVRKSARRRGHRPRLLGALVAAVLPRSCHLAVTFTRHSEISRLPSDGKATDLSGSDGRRSQAGRNGGRRAGGTAVCLQALVARARAGPAPARPALGAARPHCASASRKTSD